MTPERHAFYDARHLPHPVQEHWPETTRELCGLIRAQAFERPALILGNGDHVRGVPRGAFDVICTPRCDALLHLDKKSGLARVEAGMRWGTLRDELATHGLSLSRYALYPEEATIAGLLARHRGVPASFHDGDIRQGCVSLSAISPSTPSRYDYLAAPRKASGPDLRHLYLGGEGRLGAILDATLVVWPRHSGRLYQCEASSAKQAVRRWREVLTHGAHVSWSCWDREHACFEIACHGPSPLLSKLDRFMARELNAAVMDHDQEQAVRREREAALPSRRSQTGAALRLHATWRLDKLAARLDALSAELQAVQVTHWTAHTVEVSLCLAKEVDAARLLELSRDSLELFKITGQQGMPTHPWLAALGAHLDPHARLVTAASTSSLTASKT